MTHSSPFLPPEQQQRRSACFHCKRDASQLRLGWRLRNGGFAGLCNDCASAYEEGRFCEIHHINTDGWRNCNYCQKPLHCGCIMSAHMYIELDYEGVSCMECFRKDFDQDTPETLKKLDESSAVEQSVGSVEVTGGTFLGGHQSRTLDHPHSSGSIVHLFEKQLTQADVNDNVTCLALPKEIVEKYFPKPSELQGVPIEVEDTQGKHWKFQLCSRSIENQKMYVLEVPRECILSMRWEPSDIVIFYLKHPEGRFGVELKRAQTVSQSVKSDEEKGNMSLASSPKSLRPACPASVIKWSQSCCFDVQRIHQNPLYPEKASFSSFYYSNRRHFRDYKGTKMNWIPTLHR